MRDQACTKCDRDYGYGTLGTLDASSVPLKGGLCVDCLPVAHTCDCGAECEWDRFILHTGNHSEHLFKLRLCDQHQQRFDETKPGGA